MVYIIKEKTVNSDHGPPSALFRQHALKSYQWSCASHTTKHNWISSMSNGELSQIDCFLPVPKRSGWRKEGRLENISKNLVMIYVAEMVSK